MPRVTRGSNPEGDQARLEAVNEDFAGKGTMAPAGLLSAANEKGFVRETRLSESRNEEVIGASREICACNGNPNPVTERVGFEAGQVDGEVIFILNDNVLAFQVKSRIKGVVGDLPQRKKPANDGA